MKKLNHPRRINERALTRLLDEIKDEIDRLHEIAHPAQRTRAARELAEYLHLHHGVTA